MQSNAKAVRFYPTLNLSIYIELINYFRPYARCRVLLFRSDDLKVAREQFARAVDGGAGRRRVRVGPRRGPCRQVFC